MIKQPTKVYRITGELRLPVDITLESNDAAEAMKLAMQEAAVSGGWIQVENLNIEEIDV